MNQPVTADQRIIEVLAPFAEIGQWLFARPEVPDDQPVVSLPGINGYQIILTRGHFKAAHTMLETLTALDRPALDIGKAWQAIKGRNIPDMAEYERSCLERQLNDDPDAAVLTLLTYATTQPKAGTFAGSLWALAEYVKTLQTALGISGPEIAEKRED